MSEPSQSTLATEQLTPEERQLLLHLARQALAEGVAGRRLTPLSLSDLPPRLREPGASFVTLTIQGELRGCIGSLEASQPLAEDVRQHAMDAALKDYRFLPVQPEEVKAIAIEISRLTPTRLLEYQDAKDLLARLRPGVDGVVLSDGLHRATFLPQVWEKVPDPELFLGMLCRKMGAATDTWRLGKLTVFTYQVEEFHE